MDRHRVLPTPTRFALLLLFLSSSCTLIRPVPGWDQASPDGRLVHSPSGFSFPSELPGLKRGTLRAYDESGANASVSYAGTTYPLVVTVFIYPRALLPNGSPEDHLRAAVVDVLRAHPGARLEREIAGISSVPLSDSNVEGYRAFATFVEGGRDCGSWILIVPAGDDIVKLRATYDRGDNDAEAGPRLRDSYERMLAILASLKATR